MVEVLIELEIFFIPFTAELIPPTAYESFPSHTRCNAYDLKECTRFASTAYIKYEAYESTSVNANKLAIKLLNKLMWAQKTLKTT